MSEVFNGYREIDKPRDECGIVVVVSPNYDATQTAATAIEQLKNRGDEMTGLVVDKDRTPLIATGFGTGADLFADGGYAYSISNPSRRALAHARYSTQGTQDLAGAQPHGVARSINGMQYHVTHIENGNLMNTHDLAESQGVTGYASDNDLMAYTFMNKFEEILLESPHEKVDPKELIRRTVPLFEGAFTAGVMLDEDIVVYTDHHGLKPGVIGQLENGGTIVASEITALESVNATYIREMNPGEMVIIHTDGSWEAEQWAEPEPKHCVLELLYVITPETEKGVLATFGGLVVNEARKDAGRAVAKVKPIWADAQKRQEDATIEADFGLGIPNSGLPVGEGLCETRGLPNNKEAIRARDKKRTFIQPTQEQREDVVGGKLILSRKELEGKVVETGDDSIIRGTVGKNNSASMREAGVKEIHMRSGAPMLLFTCERGIDLGKEMELLAAKSAKKLGIEISGGYNTLTQEQLEDMTAEMANYIGVDSLAFLTPELLYTEVLRKKAAEFCTKCMTGEEPSVRPTPVELTRKELTTAASSIV